MGKRSVRVTLDVDVYDEDAFRSAAHARAIEDGDDDARRFLDAEETGLDECAQMLLDPGIGPPGSSIEQSTCEDLDLLSED